MKLYQRVGTVFTMFSLAALVGNLLTPENKDHLLNVLEQLVLTIVFIGTIVIRKEVAKPLQVGALFAAAAVAAFTRDIGPATILGTTAVLLTYVYGRFQRISKPRMTVVALVQASLALLAALRSGEPFPRALVMASLWAVFPLVGVWLLWSVFQSFAEEIIAQNRELLEINKTLVAGGKDAPH